MKRRRPAEGGPRWPMPVFATILALGLLTLTMLEATLVTENAGLRIISLVPMGILLLAGARLCLQMHRLAGSVTVAVSPSHISERSGQLVLFALTLLAAGLRLYHLGQESLWVDEVWTAQWATQALTTVVQIVNPLAYVVAHLTLLASRSEFALRLAPALAGIALIPAVYVLGRTLYGRKVGLIAAALTTVSVYAVEHSQEVRFYSWQMLFSTLTLYFLLRGLADGRWRDWAGFALTTALNLYSHPFGLFVLASEGLYVLWFCARTSVAAEHGANLPVSSRLGGFLKGSIAPGVAALFAIIAFLPLLSPLLRLNNSLWVADAARSQHLPLGMDNWSWSSVPVAFGSYGMLAEYLDLRSAPFLVYPVLAIFFLGLLSDRRRAPLVLFWFLLPLPILFWLKYWLQPRYLSYFLPLFLVVTARGIAILAATITTQRRRETTTVALLTGLVALPSLIQLPGYYIEPQEDQWREVTAFVESNYEDGDLVLITSAYDPTPLPFEWYATTSTSALPRQVFPEGPETGVLTHNEQLDLLPSLTQGYERVWLVLCYVGKENQALIEGAMKHHRVIDEWNYVGLDLLLFEAHPNGQGQ